MTSFELWLCNDKGVRLAQIENFVRLDATRIANRAGVCLLDLPSGFDVGLLGKDYVIEVWRKSEGAYSLFNMYFIRRIQIRQDGPGRYIQLTGYDPNYLAGGRIVYEYAGSTGADKTDYLDDMIKAIWSEQAISNSDTDRNWDSLSVENDWSAAPSSTIGFAYRNVQSVFDSIVNLSRGEGTRLYWALEPSFSTATSTGIFYRFRLATYINQPGQDLTESAGSQIFFGPTYGNIKDAVLTYDWSNEATVVYAAGLGQEAARIRSEQEDTDRSQESVWSRREAFADARFSGGSSTSVAAVAKQKLAEHEPILNFTGTLVDTEAARYGRDWDFGDRITVTMQGIELDAVIEVVYLRIDQSGGVSIEARVEATESGTLPLPLE